MAMKTHEPSATAAGGAAPLIGRERDMAALVEALSSPPSVVTVEGEAGIGKTRLVREAVAAIPNSARVLVGTCHPVRDPFPFGPFIRALTEVKPFLQTGDLPLICGALHPHLPELRDVLPPPLEPLEDAAAEKHRVFRAIAAALHVVSPVLLVLEDLHWADPSTLHLVGFLSLDPPKELSMAVTFREDELTDASVLLEFAARPGQDVSAAAVSLGPLDQREVGRMAAAILGIPDLDEEVGRRLAADTGGIPFLIEEEVRLASEASEETVGPSPDVLDRLGPPPRVRGFVQARVARLDDDAAGCVRAAAVAGLPLPASSLARIAGVPRARATGALSSATDAGLLREAEPGIFAVRHELGRQSVYGSIASPHRRELHRRTALALEGLPEPPVAQLAHHWGEAGDAPRLRRYAEEAAGISASLGDDAAAAEFLERALGAAGGSRAVRARLASKLGKSALHGLSHERAVPLLQRILAEEAALPAGTRGELLLSLGWLLLQAGDFPGGFDAVRRSVDDLKSRPGLRARAMSTLAMPWIPGVRVEEHLRWMDSALRLARRQPDRLVRAAVMGDRATLLLHMGDPQGWDALQALEEPRGTVEVDRRLCAAWCNAAQVAFFLGHSGRARELLDRAEELARTLGYRRVEADMRSTDVLLRWGTGAWEGLEEEARRRADESRDRPPQSVGATVAHALVKLSVHGPDAAHSDLGRALDLGVRTGAFDAAALVAATLARVRLREHQPEEALQECERLLALIEEKGMWTWGADLVPSAVEALAALRRVDEAEKLTGAFADGLRHRDAPAARAGLAWARAVLVGASDGPEAAAGAFSRAAGRWSRVPRPLCVSLMRERQALCLLEAGDEQGGARLLNALELATSLGADWEAARLRRSARSHGIRLPYPYRGGRRGYGTALSPRELDVVRLVAEGATNAEVAERLFLSPHTVANHLQRAMRKLQVASRREVAAALPADQN